MIYFLQLTVLIYRLDELIYISRLFEGLKKKKSILSIYILTVTNNDRRIKYHITYRQLYSHFLLGTLFDFIQAVVGIIINKTVKF